MDRASGGFGIRHHSIDIEAPSQSIISSVKGETKMSESRKKIINNITVAIAFLNLAIIVLKLVKEAAKD